MEFLQANWIWIVVAAGVVGFGWLFARGGAARGMGHHDQDGTERLLREDRYSGDAVAHEGATGTAPRHRGGCCC